ncbi:MAG: hypothetical protein C0501_19740 [Isosphaera sp.]|nr:hypothetical protein [Isosphaera sp.]
MRAFAAAALCLAGCGGGPEPVSGVVTLDGTPVEGAAVTFAPEAGDGGGVGGSYGRTGPDGRYTLKTVVGDRPGAARGKHRVTVSKTTADPANPDGRVREAIPARYTTPGALTVDVPAGGTTAADLVLTTR